ncbi:DUF2142 domain-containing protein [Neokomagataea thailandica]|uniref:DUF2142 domain-containing protein n=1 Tax=Neokomagataea tanensis NBRC 106556 TaxID=1223519 RepID=A0ABQ0QFY9_9PROT|nr:MULTISPECIES: DUF2142 domain-containing protein [Neokomagataea]GBR43383.1 hypothetical protein AA106556_0071 [Neokomagataea tanensis NBRC 106556]
MYRRFLAAVLSDEAAFRRFFAFLWALIIGPVLVGMVFLTPPIQVPDEEHHFLRAAQIGEGHIFGDRLTPWSSGGVLPHGAVHFAYRFNDLFFHYDHKITVAQILAAREDHWDTPREQAAFPNTVIYAPFFYIPQALGIDLGRVTHRSVLVSFYMGRLASVLCCVVVAALALAVTRRGRVLMAVVLSLPMTLSLYASCSQDGLFIASCALCVALLTHIRGSWAEPRWYWAVLAVLLGALLASKPPYVMMAFLPLLVAVREHRLRAVCVALVALAVMGVWSVYGMHPVDITTGGSGAVNGKRQALRLFHHPWVAVVLVIRTVQAFGAGLYQQYVGVLGWLDAPVVTWFSPIAAMAALYGLISAVLQARFRRSVHAWGQCLGTLAIIAATFCGVSLALYMIWTPVGQSLILGLQGRYYLGWSLFLVLLLPEVPRSWRVRVWRGGDAMVMFAVLCVSVLATYETLVLRYW